MRLVLFACSVLALGAVGCGGDSEGNCPEEGSGALQLDVSGLPSGASASVTVTRGTESRQVTGSTRLDGLGSGRWTVSAAPVATSGGLVRAAYDAPASQEVCVRKEETTNASVAYSLIPSSQKLWLSTSNGAAEVEAFSQSNLATTGSPAASVLLRSSPAIPRASGLAFDRRGNLWVALGSGELRRYPASGLGSSGEKTPDVTLSGPALSGAVRGPSPSRSMPRATCGRALAGATRCSVSEPLSSPRAARPLPRWSCPGWEILTRSPSTRRATSGWETTRLAPLACTRWPPPTWPPPAP